MELKSKTSVVWLGDQHVTKDNLILHGNRLPTNAEVLKCMYAYVKFECVGKQNSVVQESADYVYDQVLPFYCKADIVMKEQANCVNYLKYLYNNSKDIAKIPKDRRDKNKKYLEHSESLAKTCELWHHKAEQYIQTEEDKIFLESMKTDRKASWGGADILSQGKFKRKELRQEEERKRQEKEAKRKSEAVGNSVGYSEDDDEVPGTSGMPDPDFYISNKEQLREHRRTKKTGETITLSHDFASHTGVVALLKRGKVSSSLSSQLMSKIVEIGGGNPDKFSLSYASLDRFDRRVCLQLCEDIKDSWKPSEVMAVHWDGKLVCTLDNKYKKEERCAVLVSGEHGTKLLSVLKMEEAEKGETGKVTAQSIHQQLQEWNCSQSICAMVFDTTSSNTGHLSASCISLQAVLGRPLLWLACRHHVAEIVLAHVYRSMKIEVEKSPESTIFNAFRNKYHLMNDNNLSFSFSDELPDNLKVNLISFLESFLHSNEDDKYLPRGDYKELLELMLSIMKGHLVSPTLQKPGATHKARWMNKLLYCIKIVLLEEEVLQQKVCSKPQIKKFKKLLQFVLTCYAQYWFLAPSQVNAPANDLLFMKDLEQYKSKDKAVADVAIKAFSLHTWYLCSELIPLALFSSRTTDIEKAEIVQALQACRNDNPSPSGRFGTGFGKPKLVQVDPHTTALPDLISNDSWFFFKALKLNTDFLTEEVIEWQANSSYVSSCSVVNNLKVVNDTAERGVKLGTEYLSSANTESRYQNILQSVEYSYKKTPDLRKKAKLGNEDENNLKWVLHT